MRTRFIRSLFLLVLLAPTLASANGTTGVISISSSNLQLIASPWVAYLYVTITGGGCTYSNAAVLTMDPTANPAANSIYAMLLAAKTTGKTVNIATTGCSSAGYPMITSLYFES